MTCLRSLLPQCGADVEILVVDNGSRDGSDRMAEVYPGVRLLRLAENTGFTAAVLAGIRVTDDADYVILLNNDTVTGKHFVRELIAAMDRHPDACSAQARMRRMDNPRQLDDGGDMYCAIGWAYGRGMFRPSGLYGREEEIFSACGGAAIYRMKVLREIGGFDPSIFAYLEDVDLGWRARRGDVNRKRPDTKREVSAFHRARKTISDDEIGPVFGQRVVKRVQIPEVIRAVGISEENHISPAVSPL